MSGTRCPLTLTLSPLGRGEHARRIPLHPAAPRQHGTSFRPALHGPLRTDRTASSLFFPPPEGGRVREGVPAMPAYRNDGQRLHARAQRAALTPAEAVLWSVLRNHRFMGLSVRRKAPVGPWIADFLIPSRRIAVIVLPETVQPGTDHPPPGALERLGYTVLRPAAADLLPQTLPAFLRLLAARAKP